MWPVKRRGKVEANKLFLRNMIIDVKPIVVAVLYSHKQSNIGM